jgi:2-oxoglutarate ferredoxin oxidoreductase subunit delta
MKEANAVNTGKRWKTAKGTITIVDNLCKGCELCINFCPMQVLGQSEEFNEKGYHYPEMLYPEKCVNCAYCQLLCPDFAIWSERDNIQEGERHE